MTQAFTGGGCNLLINKIKRPLRAKAHKFFGAFTLSEVLVTLTILGILASIIVPNVVQQYQKRVTITKLQKAYATIEAAAANLAVSTGCVGRDISCALEFFKDVEDVDTSFAEFAGMGSKIIKKHNGNWLQNDYMYSEKHDLLFSSFSHYFILADGIGYSITLRDKGLEVMVLTEPKKIKILKTGIIKRGRNQFYLLIGDNFNVYPAVRKSDGQNLYFSSLAEVNDEIILWGCNPDNENNTAISGVNCAARIIKDGWKINY